MADPGREIAPRVTPVFRPSDYPGTPDTVTAGELDALFARLFPGVADPRFADDHAGMAIAALSPALAGCLGDLSRFMALDLPWSGRTDLRELAIQTVNLAHGCRYAFDARIPACAAAGVGAEMLAGLAGPHDNGLFDAEQALVVDYAGAVVASCVTDDLSARMVAAFGERGTVECTAVIAFWSFWALFLNATRG